MMCDQINYMTDMMYDHIYYMTHMMYDQTQLLDWTCTCAKLVHPVSSIHFRLRSYYYDHMMYDQLLGELNHTSGCHRGATDRVM